MKSEREVVRHVRHVGDGKLALYEGDTLVRHLGDTLLHFRDRDEMIVAWNAALSASVPGEAVACEWYGEKLGQHHYINVPGGRRCTKCKDEIHDPTPAVSASVVTVAAARLLLRMVNAHAANIAAGELSRFSIREIEIARAALERAP